MNNTHAGIDGDLAAASGDQDLPSEISDIGTLRSRVRAVVLRQFTRGKWCLPGSNQALEDLDLPPIEFSYSGRVSVTVDVVISGAPDRDAAADLLRENLSVDSTDTAVVEVVDFAIHGDAEYDLQQGEAC